MSSDVIYQSKGALIQFIETNMGTVTATAFVGDGSLLQNVTGSGGGGGGGISWDGDTANGIATYKNASEASVESNLTFDGSTLTVTGDASITGDATLGNASSDTVTFNAKNITLTNVGLMGGTDNTVLICDGTSVATDEIDSRVWGSTLVDASGTPVDNQVAVWTDANTLEGDSGLTFDGAHLTVGGASAKLTVEETAGGTDYRVVIDPDNGPRIQFGDDSADDAYMDIGAFGNINNIDTQGRDFHIYGSNTTSGIYFAEALGRVGILTGSYGNPPQFGLDVKGTLRTTDAMQVSGAVGLEGDLVFGAPLGISQIVDSGGNTRIYIDSGAHMSLVDRLGTANVIVQDGYVQIPTELHVASSIVHNGDTDTLINFTTDQIVMECGTKSRVTLDGTGIGLMGATPIDGVAITGDVEISGDLTVEGQDLKFGHASGQILDASGHERISLDDNSDTLIRNKSGIVQLRVNDTGVQIDNSSIIGTGMGDYARIYSARIGNAAINPGYGDLYVEQTATIGGSLQILGKDIKDADNLRAIQLTGSGQVIKPYQCAFSYYATTQQTTVANTWLKVNYKTPVFDVGSNYDNTTNTFTAPTTGKYLITATVRLDSVNSHYLNYVWMKLVTSNRDYYSSLWSYDHDDGSTVNGFATPSMSIIADMDTDDTAVLWIKNYNYTCVTNVLSPGYVTIMGYLLG